MSNLLKFDPEPFDSELPLEAFAGGTSLPDEQEEEARAGRSGARSAGRSGARSAGRSGARSLRRIGRTASAATASAARVRPFSESAGRQAFGSTRRRASQPGAPGTKGNRHRRPYFYYRGRRRRIPGLVDLDPGFAVTGSEHVRWAQTCLNSFLGLSLPLDGVLTAATRAAVRTFQERRGLPMNGLIGPETETALRDACRGNAAPETAPAGPAPADPTPADPTPAEPTPAGPQDGGGAPDAPAQEIDARGVAAGVSAGGSLADNIVRVAKQELVRWNNGTIKEADPRNREVLKDYWKTGTGNVYTSTQIASPAFQSDHPWSAAFISWVMRKAGAGDTFKYSASHSVYTAEAKKNRIARNGNPFKAYRINEIKPRIGDLVCKVRAGSGATYDTIREGMTTHCDIVTGTAPDGLEVIGGNVSQSVSKGRIPLDSAGHIKNPNYFAVIRIDARKPGIPVSANGKAPGTAPPFTTSGRVPAVGPGAAPELLKRETATSGTTLYLKIDLKISDKFGITTPPMTGVFIPAGYRPSGAVDVVLYLHGHKGGDMRKRGIDQYWNPKKFPYGALREAFNRSKRGAVLVAPSLGSRSEAGRLVEAGGLDAFMAQVMAGISAHGGAQGAVVPGSLVLACHSGGGVPMRRLASGTGAAIGKLRECWGFDCTYNSGDDTFWAGWARRAPGRKCYFYYIPQSPTAKLAQSLRDKRSANTTVLPSTELRHNYVPIKYLQVRLNSAFPDASAGNANGRFRQLSRHGLDQAKLAGMREPVGVR